MKKRSQIIIIVLFVILAAAVYIGMRAAKHGRDIIGVTTLSEENTIIMNSADGSEFTSGSGVITVQEGEQLKLEYEVSGGSFDLAVVPGADTTKTTLESKNPEGLTEPEEAGAEPVFEQTGIEGSGNLDIAVDEGTYTVIFTMQGAAGHAAVTAGTGE